ncbi:type II toxin-antitoxin system MqsA family antitoxin [Pasteurellaceae bacterium 20609_3]|uniref:helix-turn-helix domain-containing protein n=1 Tax=Spirabiliibacterium mucosae TaxID=28156 RepID=UPI001AADC3E3|nr:type II toxin-antitoxin system MqsA family antitoxin [Spirabiliibacterium mucosae]MBE2898177.1 type II toxin-antitoxin system MqsA family antitoxin [Spirabiliibacterium mucosae]
MNEEIKNWDIRKMVEAVIADDPDAEEIRESLTAALEEVKRGHYARKTMVHSSPIWETRQKSGLSQNKFAQKLGISVNTLKSWEQGQRQPSGAAATLIKLLHKRPDLLSELG